MSDTGMAQPGTKYALVLPDGAADDPVEALGGRTPLEAAHTPHMDWIASHGMQGTVRTIPRDLQPGSDVATLSVLGYDPHVHLSGRAPFEAAARDIRTEAGDLIFRCNLVTIRDGLMADFNAGHIGQEEARGLITSLNEQVGDELIAFHEGMSYRHLMVYRGAAEAFSPTCTPPHDFPGGRIEEHLPAGPGADRIVALMRRAGRALADHPVNLSREHGGRNPANAIWLWGQGPTAKLPSFVERYAVRGAAIAAVDLIRGLAKCLGWPVIPMEGATGFLDTNYAGKGAAAVEALQDYDLVAVHVEAPDEAGHLRDPAAKVQAIEMVDRHVVGPLLERLRRFERWRVLVAPDHPTVVATGLHTATPPPFCMAGTDLGPPCGRAFSEPNATRGPCVDPGHELMGRFLEASV